MAIATFSHLHTTGFHRGKPFLSQLLVNKMAETKVVITVPKSNSDELLALRTRVQQQSELIAMLKERADDTLRQVSNPKVSKRLLYHHQYHRLY